MKASVLKFAIILAFGLAVFGVCCKDSSQEKKLEPMDQETEKQLEAWRRYKPSAESTSEIECKFVLRTFRVHIELDANYQPEPCWPELREEIAFCLNLKGEIATEEKIEEIIKKYQPPEYYAELRAGCKDWAKTEQDLKDCLRRFGQTCSKK